MSPRLNSLPFIIKFTPPSARFRATKKARRPSRSLRETDALYVYPAIQFWKKEKHVSTSQLEVKTHTWFGLFDFCFEMELYDAPKSQ
jgi:hypothetical protein